MLAPFTPHLCEELWQRMGGPQESVIQVPWPEYDSQAIKKEVVQVVVQINGKVRGKFDVPADLEEAQLKDLVLKDSRIQNHVQNKNIIKFIIVPNKLVSIVLS